MSETHKKSEVKQPKIKQPEIKQPEIKQPEVDEKVIKLEKLEDEIETFFPKGGEVFIPSLNKHFTVKKFTWGKEAVLGKLLGSLLKNSQFGGLRNLTEANITNNPQIVVDVFLPLLESAPETITKMVGVILDKEEKWIEEELQAEDIIEVLIPFFTGAFKKYQNLFSKVNQRFQKQ